MLKLQFKLLIKESLEKVKFVIEFPWISIFVASKKKSLKKA